MGILDAVAEVKAEMAALSPKRSGLNEIELIGLPSAVQSYVTDLLAAYERRVRLEEQFIAAGEALLADGYPGVPGIDMDGSAFAIFRDKIANINAVYPEFHAIVLASLGLEAGEVFKK